MRFIGGSDFEIGQASPNRFTYVDMQKLTSFGLTVSLLLSIIAGSASRARAQGAVSGGAKVVRVSGVARYSVAGQPWQTLKVGDVLGPGTLVQTAKTKATVEIQLGESSGT